MYSINPDDDVMEMQHVKILPNIVDKSLAVIELAKALDEARTSKAKEYLKAALDLVTTDIQMNIMPRIIVDTEGKIIPMVPPTPKDTGPSE